MIAKKKIKDLYFFYPKSKIKAGEGLEVGKYPFYTSSAIQNKWLDTYEFNTRALVLGTGGRASLHYADGTFSVSTDCFALASKQEEVNIKFTYYYLNSKFSILERGFKGAGLKHISKDYIENIEIEYPDLEAQNKVVAILDKAKSILDKRKKSIDLYEDLLNATFFEMFGDPLDPNEVTFIPLDKIIDKIDSGWSPVCEDKARNSSAQVAILKQGAVSSRYFIPEENKLLPVELAIKKAVYAKKKDLLFSRKNTPQLVGSTVYLFEDYENLLLPDTIFKIRYDSSKVSGVYLFYLFNNIEFRKKIQQLSVGQAESMSNISQEKLLKLEIPFPEFNSQLQFENIVLKAHESIYKKFQKSRLEVERLLKSLSNQAFSERLTIDVDTELEALIDAIDVDKRDDENKIESIKGDVTFIQRLIDRLDAQEFKDKHQYDKAKHVLFRVMKEEENLVKQVFKDPKVQLTLQNEIA